MRKGLFAVLIDRIAALGDAINGGFHVRIEADIAVEGERGRARGTDRGARMLFVSQDRVVRAAAALTRRRRSLLSGRERTPGVGTAFRPG